MFRRGGSTNEGIMSGLVDRRGYAEGDKVEQDWDWMEESGLGNLFKWGGNIAMDIPGTIFDHTIAPAANWGGEFFLGSSPGWSANKIQQAVRDKLWGDKADKYDPNNPNRFYFDEDADPDVFEILGYNFSAKPTGIFADDKESTVGAANANEPGDGPIIKQEIGGENKNLNVDGSSGEPVSAADDIKTVYEDLLPLLQSTMGVDDSEMNRQKYLELAKFGANLMAQPGGNLAGAIGKAAADPLAGLTRIAETKRQTKRKPAELAMSAALDIWKDKATNPTEQKIKTLAKLGNVSTEEVVKSQLESTGEQQIRADQVKYILDGAGTKLGLKGPEGLNFAKQIMALMDADQSSLAGKFTETVPDKEDMSPDMKGNYYVDTTGDLVRWDGKQFLYISDEGFFDKKKKK